MSQIVTFETKKQNAGILWDAMSKPQRANIYFKMLGCSASCCGKCGYPINNFFI